MRRSAGFSRESPVGSDATMTLRQSRKCACHGLARGKHLPSALGPTSLTQRLGRSLVSAQNTTRDETPSTLAGNRILGSSRIVLPKVGVRLLHPLALDCYETCSVDVARDPLTNGCGTLIADSPSGCSEEPGQMVLSERLGVEGDVEIMWV